jgi:hypothetical protein
MKIQVICDFCDAKTTIQVRVPFYENLNNLPSGWSLLHFLVARKTKKERHDPLVACPKCTKHIGKYLNQRMVPQFTEPGKRILERKKRS